MSEFGRIWLLNEKFSKGQFRSVDVLICKTNGELKLQNIVGHEKTQNFHKKMHENVKIYF